ncbi:MAG: hypothetical protein IJ043_03310 [Clostridia bacterium]|nr:hypothetical protein [Clostridia bacterium]
MNEKEFVELCKGIVAGHTNGRNIESPISIDREDVYVVWLCKILQNNKALLGTKIPDGIYYEITYNGDKKEIYVDVYKKGENFVLELPSNG